MVLLGQACQGRFNVTGGLKCKIIRGLLKKKKKLIEYFELKMGKKMNNLLFSMIFLPSLHHPLTHLNFVVQLSLHLSSLHLSYYLLMSIKFIHIFILNSIFVKLFLFIIISYFCCYSWIRKIFNVRDKWQILEHMTSGKQISFFH